MKLNLYFIRRGAVLAALIASGVAGLFVAPMRADNLTPEQIVLGVASAKTNASTTSTNAESPEADKAWKLVDRASQAPMPPPEWATKSPTQEEVDKFNLDILHKGMDLARDFYTKYPNHPKAATAQKYEYEMVMIAKDQFHDTNLTTRFAAVEAKRMADPNLSEEEKLQMRMEPLEPLLRGLPDTADEVAKQVHALQKEFPKCREVYSLMVMVMSHSDPEHADAWAKEIIASPAPEDIKTNAKLTMRANAMIKLLQGLPATGGELDKSVRELPKDFPGNPLVYQLLAYVMTKSDPTRAIAIAKMIAESDAPEATKDRAKEVLRVVDLQELMKGFPGTLDKFMADIHQFEKDYPRSGDPYNLMMIAFQKNTGATAKKLGEELLASQVQDRMKMQVSAVLKQMEFVGKPVDIKYTALDGRDVDVAQMKGRVVLVDFWGVWCGVCMAELPGVKATYAKLHGKGFEIVGIDCDDPKERLLATIKDKEIPWPQYFEPPTQQNKFAAQYGVVTFPTMWLVDKQGILRDVNAAGELEERVMKLLAE